MLAPVLAALLLAQVPMVLVTPPPEPVEPGPGWFKPSEREPACVGRGVVVPEGQRAEGRVVVRFVVLLDGTADRIEVASEAPGWLADAISAAVRRCAFRPGRTPEGKQAPVWHQLALRFEAAAPAQAPAPALADPGTPPQEAEAGCIDDQFHYRRPPNRLLSGLLRFSVEVSPEGDAVRFDLPAELPEDLATAIQRSVEACTLRPALGADGQPRAGVLVRSWNFKAPGQEVRAAQAASLKRPAKLFSANCLLALRAFGVYGHAVVQVRVSEAGVPSNFRIQPENVSADMRTQIFDLLSQCKWEPALGLDDKPVTSDTAITIRFR